MLISEHKTLITCLWFNINSRYSMNGNCRFDFVSSNLVTQRFVLRHPERMLMNVIIFFGGDRGIADRGERSRIADRGSRIADRGSRIADRVFAKFTKRLLKELFVQPRVYSVRLLKKKN